jgi:tetratricopeptide (TPR) repeat protein|tara:strand:- start:18 stop:476 length:459 start_codon:yes stop_codon:yes gene_type:complete
MRAASVAYAVAVQLQPADADAYRLYGVTVRATGDTATALRAYDAALTLRPNDGLAYFSRGNALSGAQERIGAYRLAVRHLPAHYGARSNLVTMLRGEQRAEEAGAVMRDWARASHRIKGGPSTLSPWLPVDSSRRPRLATTGEPLTCPPLPR